ncbi:MAG: glycosyltransferase [Pseudomonadota bacterium]
MPSSPVQRPSVAVCLAAFNGVHYLQQQIDSIFQQTDVEVTLFVSVDQSNDGTEDWFSRLHSENDKVVLLPFGEQFGGAANNFFRLLREVDFSNFDYVAYADQDDIWLPEKLKRAADRLHASGAAGYSSDIVAFWESGRSLYVRKSYPQRRWDYLFESAGPGCTFVLTRRLVLDIQRLVQQNQQQTRDIGLHDWFTYAFARAHGYPWLIDEYASLMYRQHGKNQVGVNAGAAALLWRAKQVLSGWGLNQARLIGRLVGADQDGRVRGWFAGGRLAVFGLALQSFQCRRKPGDRIWFAVSCLALVLIGWK